MPGFHPGGEEEYTRRVLKTPIPVTSLVTLEVLDRRLGDFFGDYNNRVHSALNGLSPLQAWADDDHQPELANSETVMNAMSYKESRRLNHYGIEIRNAHYSHPTLAGLRKENVTHVEVRFHAHDRHHIEVFVDGVWECTATKTTVQPEHHRLGVLSVRSGQRREVERLIRTADYERVLAEQARLREEGIDESEMPLLPPHPDEDTEPGAPAMPDLPDLVDDLGGVIDTATARSGSLGATLSGSTIDTLNRALSDSPLLDPDESTVLPTIPDLISPTEEGAA
ncbi:Mu transposase C-terminal domain-containing protein [Nocardioides sp. B-3]|uniref:Mu transposase C-terminal domain-containing protein n=1 Tax=Nocardioides sp. B-3 TaxID=2895565 RepID=UPI0021531B79|nr:Mu transposase C-terminal domain-containing protein [Nocardioides sp. B-3]UUZ60574.1 Mu transposase C-terminal domain-containing protein [Nocardioides sp. B-3]